MNAELNLKHELLQLSNAIRDTSRCTSASIPTVKMSEHEAPMSPADVQKFHEQFFSRPVERALADLSDRECLEIQSYARRGKATDAHLAKAYRISEHLVGLIRGGYVRQNLLNNPDATTWFQPPDMK